MIGQREMTIRRMLDILDLTRLGPLLKEGAMNPGEKGMEKKRGLPHSAAVPFSLTRDKRTDIVFIRFPLPCSLYLLQLFSGRRRSPQS